MDVTPNATLPLVVTTTIMNHSISRILIDDMSLSDLMCIIIFLRLRLHGKYLKLYEVESLLVFNDSLTISCGTTELLVSFEENG